MNEHIPAEALAGGAIQFDCSACGRLVRHDIRRLRAEPVVCDCGEVYDIGLCVNVDRGDSDDE